MSEISEMKERLVVIPYMDKLWSSIRKRYLQLVRVLLKRVLFTLIEVEWETRVSWRFLGGKVWERYITSDYRYENKKSAFLISVWNSFVISEDLRRVEEILENDDEDPGKLSKLTDFYLDLTDTGSGSPFDWTCVSYFSSLSMGHIWSLFFCQKVIEETMWIISGLGEAKILQDTRSCVVPRPSDQDDDAESSYCVSKRFSLCVSQIWWGDFEKNVELSALEYVSLFMTYCSLQLVIW